MMLPLFPAGAFGESASFVVEIGVGVAFGAALERAGLGSATKLAGQFYFKDFTVFKVMFSAIVTAMLGVYLLSWLGVMDIGQLAVPSTWLLPQLAGGLLFGAGFVMGGLCPGTSCVAAASGRADGLALIAGMFAGTLLFGEMFSRLARFYESTPMRRFTLPQLLHLGDAVTVLLVTAMALTVFGLLGRWERQRAGA